MTWIRAIAVFVVLAAWVPASSHVFLEYFGIVHQLHCQESSAHTLSHHHHGDGHAVPHHHDRAQDHHCHAGDHQHSGNHDAADGRSIVHLGKLRHIAHPETAPAYALPAWLVVLDFDVVAENAPGIRRGHGVGPPEFFPRWQFSYRAALPPRAPASAT